jgi:beta-lactamase regulating signal transducer with metallopeptidase domain
MTPIETLLDKPIFQALGWTLIHFIWQGALIAILYAVVSLLLRRFSANVRYAAACAAMLLMLIAPATTMVIVRGQSFDSAEVVVIQSAPDVADDESSFDSLPQSQGSIEPADSTQPDSISLWAQERLPRAMPWLLALWFAGVLCLSLRFAGGLLMIRRMKRTETGATLEAFQETLDVLSKRLRVSRPVRLCESALVKVPTVIGWLKPIILLPASALTGLSSVQIEALLAHELAHIRRYDYLVNLLQTSIETLFFYHPAVWWVSAQIRQEREHCCDDLAVGACGDVLIYARALTALEQLRSTSPQLAVAASGGSLLLRIQRLVRGHRAAFYRFESGPAGFIALATVFILLVGAQAALLSRHAKAFVKDDDLLTLSDMKPGDADQAPDNLSKRKVERRVDNPSTPSDLLSSDPTPRPIEEQPPDAGEAPVQETQIEPNAFISDMAAAGLTNLKLEQLVALQSNGVTAQFVREISAVVPTRLTVNRIVAMRIHGVTPGFVEELKAQGLANLDADQLIAFRVHGVSSQYISELKNAGYGNASANSLLAFRIHGVTPEFIQQMKDVGFPNLSGDQLTAFRIHGVTPSFVQTMRSFIRGKLSANDLTGLRIHGVTPEMIKELENIGFGNLSADQLMGLRIHGVTPAYIKAIQAAGYDRITPDQLMELRISGVTPEFIHLVKSRGFTDVTLHQLAELRRLNILPSAKKTM